MFARPMLSPSARRVDPSTGGRVTVPDATTSSTKWVGALMLNIISGVVGLAFAVIFVLMGGLFGAGAMFGKGGDTADAAVWLTAGAGYLLTAAIVTVGPLLFGTTLALRKRPRAVKISDWIGASCLVLPWLAVFLPSL